MVVDVVNERVGKSVEVVDTKSEVPVRPASGVLDQQPDDTLELSQESFGDRAAGVLCAEDGSITQFRLGVRVNPEGHASRPLTRVSA